MSIANYSVVGRILEEAQRASPPRELGPRERVTEPDQIFELRRSTCIHREPFTTPFHFWVHALRDLLADCGRPDLFEAMATHALCQLEDGEEALAALGELAGRMQSELGVPSDARFVASYRMIDQDVMASWVAEGAGELVTFFWVRTDWLGDAAPVDLETEELEE